jgi:hypothetical protein
MFKVLSMKFTVENMRQKDTFEPENHSCYRVFFVRQNLIQAGRNIRFKKAHDIRDDRSGRRFYPFNDFEDGATLRHRAKSVRMRGFWLQRFMFVFVSNNGFELSSDNEPFPQLCVFKKKLKTILISSDIRLFKPNIEGQRKIVDVAFRTAGYSDRGSESNKNRTLIQSVTGIRKHRLTKKLHYYSLELRPILLPIKQI